MKRPELVLGAIVVAFAAFVAVETLRAPRGRPISSDTTLAAPAAPAPVPDQRALTAAPPANEHARVDMRFTGRAAPSPEALDDTRRRLRLGGPGTWIDDVLRDRDSLLVRWRARDAEPLRVWIAPARGLRNRRPGFDAAVREAFAAWSDAGAPMRVTWVRDSAAADVPVTWVERFPSDDRVGVTHVRGMDGELTWGAIVLATHTRSGAELDERWIGAIALHEVGHLYGLPHSRSDTASIMLPQAALRGLSRQDRGTMRLLYMVEAGSVKGRVDSR